MRKVRETGILLYPPVSEQVGSLDFHFAACREQLRFYLLYFDRICSVPLNIPACGQDMFGFTVAGPAYLMSEDLQTLVLQEIVEKFPIPSRIVEINKFGLPPLLADIAEVHDYANQSGEGGWAMGYPKGLPNRIIGDSYNSAVMVLRNLFPLPDLSVSLAQIIEFRNTHADLLADLHMGVDKIFTSLGADIEEAVHELQSILNQIERECSASRLSFNRADFSLTRSLFNLGADAIASLFSGAPGGSLVFELAAGGIEISPFRSRRNRPSNGYPADFEYVFLGRSGLEIDLTYEIKSLSGHVITGITMGSNKFHTGYSNEIVPESSFEFFAPSYSHVGNTF